MFKLLLHRDGGVRPYYQFLLLSIHKTHFVRNALIECTTIWAKEYIGILVSTGHACDLNSVYVL